jgi:hypothetical protein
MAKLETEGKTKETIEQLLNANLHHLAYSLIKND